MSDSEFPMATLLHLLPIKLSSTNYLLWKNQVLSVLSHQQLSAYVKGSLPAPPQTILSDKAEIINNPAYAIWLEADQRLRLLLNSSLIEESMAETLGHTTARQLWLALESAYSHDSIERAQNLRDSLRQLKKGSSSVSGFSRKFKYICDQLTAIGQPVLDSDKTHWFLCGLGPAFENFSTAHRAIQPTPPFRDLVSKAESHELFLASLHGSNNPSHAAFTARLQGSSNRGSYRGRGRGRGRGRRPPHCQLCRTDGHYAPACPNLMSFTQGSSSNLANLAQAFHNNSNVTPDWYVDSGAMAHMSPSPASVDSSHPYGGNEIVTFGNGNTLTVSRLGRKTINKTISLHDVLIVPTLSKNLLSVSKLTHDFPLDFLFSRDFFAIQDRKTGKLLTKGRHEDGLYVLSPEIQAHMASAGSSTTCASYELWHTRVGHASFNIMSLLKQTGCLSMTSLLPKPALCSSCQLAKQHRLPLINNNKRSFNVLDLIHCDLWGPAPVTSTHGFRYYVVFIDDFSRFSWFYPLKAKSDFFDTLKVFLLFVQNQFSTKVKVFQSDGGTEFVNNRVHKLFY